MLQNYFKTAWRNLVRHKVNTTINVLGLTMGITVCLIIFLLVRFELSYDGFHPDKDRIYRVVATSSGPDGDEQFGFVTTALPDDTRREISGLESVSAFDNFYTTVSVPRQGRENQVFDAAKSGEETSPIIIAQPQFFEIFHYRWLAGNAATALNEPFKVVLSEKEAERYFGRQDAGNQDAGRQGTGSLSPRDQGTERQDPEGWVGRKLIYHDSLEVTVSGIVADWDQHSDFAFRDFISFSTIEHSFLKNDYERSWGLWEYDAQGVVKLAPGVTRAQVERQFPAFMARHKVGPKEYKMRLSLQPLADIHFNEKYADNFSRKANLPTLYGMAAIAAFILVIAAINFINLSTAQSVRRAREIGVRKVLGGRRRAIVLQFLSEALLIVLFAAALALLLAEPLLAAVRSLLPRGVQLEVFNGPTFLFLAVTVLITCLLAGLYPARVLSAYQPVLSLKGQGITQLNSKSYLRKSLIVFQFTISMIFIIGTLIVGRQIHYVLTTDLGFDHDAIVIIRAGQDRPNHKRAVLAQKFREIPEVRMVARHMEAPTAKGHPGTFIENTGEVDKKVVASFDMCDTDYIPLYGMHLLVGRNLLPSDTIHEFLINETCAQQLGYRHPADALGHLVDIGMSGGKGPVVGVIRDFHSKSLHEPITPFFMSTYEGAERDVSVKLATSGQSAGRLKGALAQLEKAWKEVYPNKKFEYSFFDESIAKLYEKEEKTARIMNIAMGIAIFISCMGLFGLAAFVAEQRTKEIGIRKVLGATVMDVVSMLSVDFVRLVVMAIVIASPVAYYFMHMWLQDFAYRVPISWWIYAVAGGAAMLIALATVSFQALRAAMVNPVESLRSAE
jgi:putative ABC transport system permease protein